MSPMCCHHTLHLNSTYGVEPILFTFVEKYFFYTNIVAYYINKLNFYLKHITKLSNNLIKTIDL